MDPSTSNLSRRLFDRLYGKPRVRNVLRGELVEQMLLDALGAEWREGSDYESWDLTHIPTGTRLQVKQSAALQSWEAPNGRSSRATFSIKARVGYCEDRQRWSAPRERRCELYVFGWHPLVGEDADHRRPEQWLFYVVQTADLPPQASISLSRLQKMADACEYHQVAEAIGRLL